MYRPTYVKIENDILTNETSSVIYGNGNIIGIANAIDNKMELYDINGKQILSSEIDTYDYTLNISTLAKGVYIIRLTNSTGDIQTLKLIRY